MFPAYSSSSKPKNDNKPSEINWLSNKSFKKEKLSESAEIKQESILISSSSSSDQSDREYINEFKSSSTKKKKKKEKKKKKSDIKSKKKKHRKKKRYKSSSESSTSLENESILNYDQLSFKEKQIYLEKCLCDEEYKSYFLQFNNNELKKKFFYEDFINLKARNSFKIDKKGEPDNICFDSVHFKQLCKYKIPFSTNNNKKNQKLSKKKLRRELIQREKEKRYFSKKQQIVAISKNIEKKINNENKFNLLKHDSLSNKLWLYLQIKNEFKDENDIESNDENKLITSDYVKYLSENKHDIEKWLEFINYNKFKFNNNFDEKKNINQINLIEYNRKLGIFERAIKENNENFRLKIEFLKLKASSIELANEHNAIELIEKEFLKLLLTESFSLKNDNKREIKEKLINLFEIWFEYLKFLINSSTLSSLSFNKVKHAFQRCFNYFLNSYNDVIKNNMNKSFFMDLILQLVQSYSNFMRISGFGEKSLSVLQSLIDFNFSIKIKNENKSQFNNLNTESRKKLFEIYWDIGLPKFGEKYSTGWLNCLEMKDILYNKIESEIENNRYDDQLDLIETKILSMKHIKVEIRWFEIERLRTIINWYPFYPNIGI